jgi:hypothetical protein
MSCWHAHGPWCHGYQPYPPPEYYPPPESYYPPPRRSRRRARDADDLADYLRDLEDEIARVRRDLADLQGAGTAERQP